MFQADETNIDRYAYNLRGSCPYGQKVRVLDSAERCDDKFHIEDSETLVIDRTGQKFETARFCLSFIAHAKSPQDHMAYVCEEKENKFG